ncbi:flagellar protein FlbB [Bradyrhizobium sp. Tv2a-2]|uniref:MotE family protein n=1 Tax=Bradyrhizobium sp. Tv2a-2 TaxID=113395 RepID=UPI0003F6B772|nr:flagellar protein FlbB [Bradyrhizobium sp. Tv2a-2]
MKSYRNIRVIPVVVIAVASLAVLKVAGLLIDGGYVFDYQSQDTKPASWAQQNLNFPGAIPKDSAANRDADITGSVEKPKEEKKAEAPKPAAPETKPDAIVYHPEDAQPAVSASERAILERLQARRQELDARAREIDIRENLLKAAEKRIESRIEEMKATESRISAANEQKAEADSARFKGIVTMYESMKPKDAAKVFDRLEMPVLIEIASQIAPRKMSDILGLMQPESAERLTVELARRASGDKASASAELPKIEGKVLPQRTN